MPSDQGFLNQAVGEDSKNLHLVFRVVVPDGEIRRIEHPIVFIATGYKNSYCISPRTGLVDSGSYTNGSNEA